ncbi:MAG: phage major capsid protein [Clostridium sp.]|uniref:phage major capsid protein n=1 Tax=Clostridium sp. TaxID=1506 RepID=UPI002907EF41|nr:phage major capsid protein [Clostridium sp.]MDU7339038.1 phage major capsid protein [Clostridium sp.]
MNKEQYLAQRKSLVDAAQDCITTGKLEDAAAKTKEIETLDASFEAEAKAQANLNALRDNNRIVDLAAVGAGRVVDSTVVSAQAEAEDILDSVEYRKAFMSNVLKGTAIPAKFQNADANTKTTDVGTVIPTTIMQRIVEKLESTGMILPLVTHTAYQGGLSIPTSAVKPVATWVAEGAGSDRQKKTTGSITFTYFKLRCAISMSLEVSVVSLGFFETTFIANVVEAMTKALEQAIISGNGTTQPKGILTETVVTGQNVDVAAAGKLAYSTLTDAEAALPMAYENGAIWFMTKKTFMAFISMVDDQKQPIARTNYGIGGSPERTLLGRRVVLNDYMASYADTVAADTVVAFLFRPEDYVLNTNYAVTIKRYEDNDTDDQVTKAVMLVDGKVIDKNSLVTVTKKKP